VYLVYNFNTNKKISINQSISQNVDLYSVSWTNAHRGACYV